MKSPALTEAVERAAAVVLDNPNCLQCREDLQDALRALNSAPDLTPEQLAEIPGVKTLIAAANAEVQAHLRLNARMLARQNDLAREAENKLAQAVAAETQRVMGELLGLAHDCLTIQEFIGKFPDAHNEEGV